MSTQVSPILSVPLPDQNDAESSVYSALATAVNFMEQFSVPRLNDLSGLVAKVPSPYRGQGAFLNSPGIGVAWNGSSWVQVWPAPTEADRQTYNLAGGGGVYDGLNNYDLATKVINRATPYVVLAVASSRTTGLVGAADLRIVQVGNPAPVQWCTVGIVSDNVGASCTAIIPMTAGGTLTVKANLNLAANSRVQVYIDPTHSHLQTLVLPLGTTI